MKNVTVDQVDAMMAAGQISADEGITAILTTVQDKIDNGGPLGSATKNLIGDTVGGQVQTLKNQLGDLFEDSTLGEPIKEALKTINGLLSANSATGKKLREIIGGALQFITNLLKQLLTSENINAVFDAIIGVAETLRDVFNTLQPYIEALAGPLWDGIKEAVGPVITYFKDLFSGKGGAANPKLIQGLKDLGRVLGWIVGVILDVIGVAALLAAGLTALCYTVAAGVVEAIKQLGEFFSEAATSIGNFVTDIIDSVGGLYDSAIEAAGDFIDGLIQGIIDGWDAVVSKVSDLCGAVVDTVVDKLDIGSPSKVMAQLGMFTALGFAKGVNDNAGAVTGAIGDMTGSPLAAAVSPSRAPSSPSGPASVSIGDIVVHVPEGTKDPQAFGRAVGTEVRAQVLAIFEELGIEVGASAA